MTINEALQYAKQTLDNIESKILIKYILKKDNTYIISNGKNKLSDDEESILNKYVNKLKNGYPLQYITNNQEFMGLNFYVDENVLIPQPDTEVLVESAIKYITEITVNKKISINNIKLLDLCTGSGAIAISLKKYIPQIKVYASDISEKALEISKINANNNNVEINFIKSDMFKNINEKFDIIVSNPPYIKTSEISKLSKDVQNEPVLALDGGEDGLKFYRLISEQINNYLKSDGILMMEIGFDQANQVRSIFKNAKIIKDYAKNDRVVIWNRSQKV